MTEALSTLFNLKLRVCEDTFCLLSVIFCVLKGVFMDKKILEEIAERAKQRSTEAQSAPPSAPPLSALTQEFDPSALAALSAQAALNLWKPQVSLSSNRKVLESVVSADGKRFFIGKFRTNMNRVD